MQMKFAMISRRNILAHDIDWKFIPNTYFFGTTDKWDIHNFLNLNRDFVWWKNTFYIAIQLLYRLGFRKVYLVGCKFDIDNDKKQYSYDTKLDEGAVKWNQKTYGQAVKNMIKLQRLCEKLQKVAIDVMDDPIFKEKLEKIRSIVCRDIVVPESLYV